MRALSFSTFFLAAVFVCSSLLANPTQQYNCDNNNCAFKPNVNKGETSIYLQCNGATIPYESDRYNRTGAYTCSTPNVGPCIVESNSSVTTHIKDTKESYVHIYVWCNCQDSKSKPNSNWYINCFDDTNGP